MPPFLRDTPSQRSPSPIQSFQPLSPPQLCTLGCRAPPGSHTAPKGAQGTVGRTHHSAVLTGSGVWGCPRHDSESSGSRW